MKIGSALYAVEYAIAVAAEEKKGGTLLEPSSRR